MVSLIKFSSLVFLIIFELALLVIAGSPTEIWAVDRDEAKVAAAEGLKYWLDVIPKQDLSAYGFSNKAQLAQATLGEPFRVHTIPTDKIIAYSGEEITSIIFPMNMWFFPIITEGETRAFLTIDLVDGVLKAVAIGAAGLARQLDAIKALWSPNGGFNLKLVRVYPAKSDFVILLAEGVQGAKIIPLTSAAFALELPTSTVMKTVLSDHPIYSPFEASELMPKLKEVVQRALNE